MDSSPLLLEQQYHLPRFHLLRLQFRHHLAGCLVGNLLLPVPSVAVHSHLLLLLHLVFKVPLQLNHLLALRCPHRRSHLLTCLELPLQLNLLHLLQSQLLPLYQRLLDRLLLPVVVMVSNPRLELGRVVQVYRHSLCQLHLL